MHTIPHLTRGLISYFTSLPRVTASPMQRSVRRTRASTLARSTIGFRSGLRWSSGLQWPDE